MLVDNATPTRWWIPPPGPDESLRSTLNRAAVFYKRAPERLWESLNQHDSRTNGSIDAPSCIALRRMASALGVSARYLSEHREIDTPWRVPAALGRSYCPLCWNRDIADGHPLRMFRSWNNLLCTRCPKHNFPLSYAPTDWATKDRPGGYPIPNLTARDWAILDLIETFGRALEQSLFFGAPWPEGWQDTPHAARAVLILVNWSQASIRDFAATNGVQPESDGLWALVRGIRYRQEPPTRLCWETFRSLTDPAHRRAALWLAAWEFIPGLPNELAPKGRIWQRSGGRYYRCRLDELSMGVRPRRPTSLHCSWPGALDLDTKRRLPRTR